MSRMDVTAAGGRWMSPLLFVSLAGGWGITYSLNRIATTGGVPFGAYAFWAVIGGGIILLALCAVRRDWPHLSPIYLRAYVINGLLSSAIPLGVLAVTASKVPAGVLAMQLTLIPTCTYLAALATKMERFDVLRCAGVLLGLAGVLMVLVPRTSLPSPEMALWALLGLVMPISAGFSNIVAVRIWPPGARPLPLACGFMFASAMFLLPLMLVTGEVWFFETGADRLAGVVIAMAAIVGLFRIGYYELIRREGPLYFAMHNYLGALAGIGWAVLIFAEGYSGWIWGSLGLLFAGMALVMRGAKRAAIVRPN
jgi:drug/metabolite transporter (DMT)-like permease